MTLADRYRLRVSHTTFVVVFSLLLYAASNAINIDKLARWFLLRDGYNYIAVVAYLLAGLSLFIAFFTLLAHRRTIKPVAVLLVLASAPATYFISKYDAAIDRSMIANVLHTDATEVGQLLSFQMIPYAALLIALPLTLIALTEIGFAAGGRYLLGSAKLLTISLALAAIALYSSYSAIYTAGNVSRKYIVYSLVPLNVISGSLSVASRAVRPYLRRQTAVEVSGKVTTPGDLVVVLAVGESSRKKNFSLYGYARRNTNPALQATTGLHLLNARARRGSTLYALPQILQRGGVSLPLIVSRLGIPTACYVNYTLYENCVEPGETKATACGHGGRCYDEDVIPLLQTDLAAYASGYRFIVLHLGGGSHGPTYSDRHPPEFERFEPMCRDADVANRCTREELYNSYDNTILYVDFVVSELVARLEKSGLPFVFIYLSDHGESLLEDGRMFHGMPPGVDLPPEQAEIPLIVKASVPIRIVARREYEQQDVFDTVLDLFSVETAALEPDRSFIQRVGTAAQGVSDSTAQMQPHPH